MSDRTRVLVVDDEPAILRAVSRALASRGYVVRQADTGQKALDMIASDPPEIVLLDLCLPDIDGVDVCRQVRAWSSIPIIVLSASWDDHRKVEALDEGANDYVTKPYSTPELLARLRATLRSSTAPRPLVDESVFVVDDLRVDVGHHTLHVGERGRDLRDDRLLYPLANAGADLGDVLDANTRGSITPG